MFSQFAAVSVPLPRRSRRCPATVERVVAFLSEEEVGDVATSDRVATVAAVEVVVRRPGGASSSKVDSMLSTPLALATACQDHQRPCLPGDRARQRVASVEERGDEMTVVIIRGRARRASRAAPAPRP